MSDAFVVAVHRRAGHGIGKDTVESVSLLEGIGVDGDAHGGETVKHRSRVARDPSQPNLRQVHLVGVELFGALRAEGFEIAAGHIGENVTTRGVDLLALPRGTRLHLGTAAIVELTGLRNPCTQLDELADGLMSAMLPRDVDGALRRRAGVMSIVVRGGDVRAGDAIRVELPSGERVALTPV